MFTGLVTAQGKLLKLEAGPVTRLLIRAPYKSIRRGESIACDGVCLTVTATNPKAKTFSVAAAPETLARTTLKHWQVGRTINLERALALGDRLGGHWVQGHVDAEVTLKAIAPQGGSRLLTLSLPTAHAECVVHKGSVTLDGVSLTVAALAKSTFRVMLIPETLQQTTLGTRRVGDALNLEVDILGKYVARLLAPHRRRS